MDAIANSLHTARPTRAPLPGMRPELLPCAFEVSATAIRILKRLLKIVR
jgi:hypothetical protein